MDDNLPLIPDKPGAVCGDVRGLLREVFREAGAGRAAGAGMRGGRGGCGEWALVEGRARQLAGEAGEAGGAGDAAGEGRVGRAALLPTPAQHAAAPSSLWVRQVADERAPPPPPPPSAPINKRLVRPLPPIPNMKCCANTHTPTREALVSCSECAPGAAVVCVPPALHFLNFCVGREYVAELRLLNVYRQVVKVVVVPPARGELVVRRAGRRGGAAGGALGTGTTRRLAVYFRPCSRRPLSDRVLIKDSLGHTINIPITCYLQPPLLEIMVPWGGGGGGSGGSGGGCSVEEEVELGARLLGHTHHVPLVLRCEAEHAAFFLVAEESWLARSVPCGGEPGAVSCGEWAVRPRAWAGGGVLRGEVWARVARVGLQLAALRVLCSTAVARPLLLLADSLLYRPEHITLHAHEKTYDICNDSDSACEHYLNLGTAYPNQTISATVQLINHSPVSYPYYWMIRKWGECWCAHSEVSSSVLCDHAAMQLSEEADVEGETTKHSVEQVDAGVKVSRAEGELRARASEFATVSVDATLPVGLNRIVIMLILKDIPAESIPPDCKVDIINRQVVPLEPMPGEAKGSHEVVEVIHTQTEVWWEVCRLQYSVSPTRVRLASARLNDTALRLRATQLSAARGARAHWRLPARLATHLTSEHAHATLQLDPVHSVSVTLHLTLPPLPDERPEFDVISLETDDPTGKWISRCVVERHRCIRHPQLRPVSGWCGIVAPCEPVDYTLMLTNNTFQEIFWHAEVYRWWRECEPHKACAGASACDTCYNHSCTCDLLKLRGGVLPTDEQAELYYHVHAPRSEGCVATIVLAHRGSQSERTSASMTPITGRATVVAYRVLYTRLVLQVLPCREHETDLCSVCVCEEGASHAPLLRVCGLTVGATRSRRLRLRSLTPLPANGHWLPPLEKEDLFEVKFIPNEFKVDGYGETEITVEVFAHAISSRRVCVRAAAVSHASVPLYLLLVLSATGVSVSVEFPAPSVCRLQLTQKKISPRSNAVPHRTDSQIFADEDKRRAKLIENICRCKASLKYLGEQKPLHNFAQPSQPVVIVDRPPSLTRVCPCMEEGCRPMGLGGEGPPCLQLCGVRVGDVVCGTIRLVSQCGRTVKWRAALRYSGPLARKIVCAHGDEEQWTGESGAGLCGTVSPREGVLLGARAGATAGERDGSSAELCVRVRPTAWGVYREQLLVLLEELEPLVVMVWVHVVAPPLRPALAARQARPVSRLPAPQTAIDHICTATVWMNGREPRGVYVTNVASCAVTVYPYLLKEQEVEHRVLPFRVYLRFYDDLPEHCPCVDRVCEQSESEMSGGPWNIEAEFGLELYITADYGVQDDSYYKLWPECLKLEGNSQGVFHVRPICAAEPLYGRVAPEHTLLLRAEPDTLAGEWWCRPRAPVTLLRIKERGALPRLIAPIKTYAVKFSAIIFAKTQTLNLRKYVRFQNVGEGPIDCCVRVCSPWWMISTTGTQVQELPMCLAARSAAQICVVVCLAAQDICPPLPEVEERGPLEAEEAADAPRAMRAADAPPSCYPPRVMLRSTLEVYDQRTVLETVSLLVEIELPRLIIRPDQFDFGFVCDGDIRKTYFTVLHTSRTEKLDVIVEWHGAEEFSLYPNKLQLGPGEQKQVYLRYSARWRSSPASGAVVVVWAGRERGGGGWCRAAAAACACATRDHKWRLSRHDHTDC